MKSPMGCEEIVASSFLSALFTPEKPTEIFNLYKKKNYNSNNNKIKVVEKLRERSYQLQKYTLLDSEASVQVPERCPVTCRL